MKKFDIFCMAVLLGLVAFGFLWNRSEPEEVVKREGCHVWGGALCCWVTTSENKLGFLPTKYYPQPEWEAINLELGKISNPKREFEELKPFPKIYNRHITQDDIEKLFNGEEVDDLYIITDIEVSEKRVADE